MNSDEPDSNDFLDAMEGVAPLSTKPRVIPESTPGETTPAQLRAREVALGLTGKQPDTNPLTLGVVPPRDPMEVIEWKKDGVQHAVFNKLKKGRYDIEGYVDLHHKTVKEARVLVYGLIRKAMLEGWRCLLIAHGKGIHSATPAKLKSYVAHWLSETPEVIAFHSASRQQGGTGAMYVLLRKSEKKREETRERLGQKSSEE